MKRFFRGLTGVVTGLAGAICLVFAFLGAAIQCGVITGGQYVEPSLFKAWINFVVFLGIAWGLSKISLKMFGER